MFEGILIAIGILIFIGGVMAVADGAPKGDKKVWMVGATIVGGLLVLGATDQTPGNRTPLITMRQKKINYNE